MNKDFQNLKTDVIGVCVVSELSQRGRLVDLIWSNDLSAYGMVVHK